MQFNLMVQRKKLCTHTHTHTHTHTYRYILYWFFCQWTLCCFHVLATVNSTAMNIRVHVSFQIRVFSRYMLRSGTAGAYGNSIFSLLRNRHTVFHSCFTNLHSHQKCRKVFFFPYPLQHLLFTDFLWWLLWLVWGDNLIVVLICISLIISSFEHLFMYFLAICLLWRSVYLGLLPIFELDCLGFFFCYWTAWAVCIFWRWIPCQLLHSQILCPILWIFFSFCLQLPLLCKNF